MNITILEIVVEGQQNANSTFGGVYCLAESTYDTSPSERPNPRRPCF